MAWGRDDRTSGSGDDRTARSHNGHGTVVGGGDGPRRDHRSPGPDATGMVNASGAGNGPGIAGGRREQQHGPNAHNTLSHGTHLVRASGQVAPATQRLWTEWYTRRAPAT
jgi:hypothetical protein